MRNNLSIKIFIIFLLIFSCAEKSREDLIIDSVFKNNHNFKYIVCIPHTGCFGCKSQIELFLAKLDKKQLSKIGVLRIFDSKFLLQKDKNNLPRTNSARILTQNILDSRISVKYPTLVILNNGVVKSIDLLNAGIIETELNLLLKKL